MMMMMMMIMMMMMMMQVLLSWLESLPKSDTESLAAPPSPGHSHNNSIDSNINTINRRNQTLTRTNPYRHKVLTNGSFVSLKDIPSGCSEEGSARLTASTGTDDSGSPDTSSGSGLASAGDYNNIGLTSKSIREVVTHSGPGSVPGPGQASVKRSNTMVASVAPVSLSAA